MQLKASAYLLQRSAASAIIKQNFSKISAKIKQKLSLYAVTQPLSRVQPFSLHAADLQPPLSKYAASMQQDSRLYKWGGKPDQFSILAKIRSSWVCKQLPWNYVIVSCGKSCKYNATKSHSPKDRSPVERQSKWIPARTINHSASLRPAYNHWRGKEKSSSRCDGFHRFLQSVW